MSAQLSRRMDYSCICSPAILSCQTSRSDSQPRLECASRNDGKGVRSVAGPAAAERLIDLGSDT